MHVRVFVRVFSSIYIHLDYPRTHVRFVCEFSAPNPSTLTAHTHSWSLTPQIFSQSPVFECHVTNLPPTYVQLQTRVRLYMRWSFFLSILSVSNAHTSGCAYYTYICIHMLLLVLGLKIIYFISNRSNHLHVHIYHKYVRKHYKMKMSARGGE